MLTNRIAINSVALYSRTAVGIVLSLFSSRWILNGLGVSDLGIFAVMSGLVGIVTVITGATSSSAQRFLAHAIGGGDKVQSVAYFNANIAIHAVGVLIALVVGQTAGSWFLHAVLSIPSNRIEAAEVVYQCVLFSSLVGIATAPIAALYVAKQRLALMSGIELLPLVAMFAVAYMMERIEGDRLQFYAVASVTATTLACALQIWVARAMFEEFQISWRLLLDRSTIRAIAKFSGWTLLGAVGSVSTRQGSAVLLNFFFGTGINAAYQVAEQVTNHASSVTAGFLKSVNPEVATREGRQERDRSVKLAISATKYAALLTLLWMVPLTFYLDAALDVWLVDVPEYASDFALMLLLVVLFDNLTIGYPMLVQSIGQIASYQLTIGILIMLSLPISFLALSSGSPPMVVPAVVAALTFVQMLARVFWVWRLAGVSPFRWLREIVKPAALSFAVPLAVLFLIEVLGGRSAIPPLIVIVAVIAIGAIGIWAWGLAATERRVLINLVELARHRIAATPK